MDDDRRKLPTLVWTMIHANKLSSKSNLVILRSKVNMTLCEGTQQHLVGAHELYGIESKVAQEEFASTFKNEYATLRYHCHLLHFLIEFVATHC